MKKLLMICVMLLWVQGTTFAQDGAGDIVGRINALRTSKGLPTYNINGALVAAAQSQAQWLVDNNCAIAHTHPDGSNPRSRALAAGYSTGNVGENIYCGGMAGPNNAWTFWVNSGIHYAGLVNTRYKEVGVASAAGAAGTSFVIVFGDPGGPAYVPPAQPGSENEASAPQAPPSYVVGVDVHGNIEHQIQSGDTLGQIALIYGYTWNDIPGMLALNGMTEADYRRLKEGEIFLVPPKAGTYTPTPGDAAVAAVVEAATATPQYPTPYPEETLILPEPTQAAVAILEPTIAPQMVATANNVPESVVTLMPAPTVTHVQAVALVSTGVAVNSAAVLPASSNTPPWLVVALGVQVVVLVGAGFEYIRRNRRR